MSPSEPDQLLQRKYRIEKRIDKNCSDLRYRFWIIDITIPDGHTTVKIFDYEDAARAYLKQLRAMREEILDSD